MLRIFGGKKWPVRWGWFVFKINKHFFGDEMSSGKFFDNPFPDYTAQLGSELIANGKPKVGTKLVGGLKDKLEETSLKYKYLDFNDNSVYTGTSGIALLKLRNDENTNTLAEVKDLIGLNRVRKRDHTFLCGDAGPLSIGAVVTHKLGDKGKFEQAVQALKSMEKSVFNIKSDLPNEYLYGRAGYLYAVLFVNKNVSPPPFDKHFIRKIIESILTCGKNEAKAGKFKCPLMYQWHGSFYLGAAHGVSGILYLLLQVKEYLTDAELYELIKPTIDYLINLRFPSGNFPSSLGKERDSLVQWCHGAPGFLYLFTAAYKVFNEESYLELALECGDVIWQRGVLRKGYSLCHGVSGNGYCFLELYQTTKDEKHLYRAIKFAEWCMDYTKHHEEYSPDRPLSLYEGITGPMYFLVDILNPLKAKFPGFTL